MHSSPRLAYHRGQRRSIYRGAGPQDDKGLDRFAPFLVRYTDHGCCCDFRVRAESVLHLGWIDVEASRDDEVFLAIHQVVVALLVAVSHIASVQPAVRKGLGSSLGLLPIARHEKRSLHADFADLASASDIAPFVVALRKRQHQIRRFCLAVYLNEARAEHLQGLPDALWCHRSSAVD